MNRVVLLFLFLALESHGFEYDPADLKALSEVPFSEVVIYEFRSRYGENIESIPSAKRTTKKVTLDTKGLSRLNELLEGDFLFTGKKSWSACYHPHHAIVLKNSEGGITSVHVCLSCNNFVVSGGPTQALENPDEFIEFLRLYKFPLTDVQL